MIFISITALHQKKKNVNIIILLTMRVDSPNRIEQFSGQIGFKILYYYSYLGWLLMYIIKFKQIVTITHKKKL